jgi:hypothetical protein
MDSLFDHSRKQPHRAFEALIGLLLSACLQGLLSQILTPKFAVRWGDAFDCIGSGMSLAPSPSWSLVFAQHFS